jgi:hypothetical protein
VSLPLASLLVLCLARGGGRPSPFVAMAQLADLVNLDLSDCTEKIIAEYIW